MPQWRQGIGQLHLAGGVLTWTQRGQPVYSVFGLAPRWAPPRITIPLEDMVAVTLRAKWFSPEVLVVTTHDQELTLRTGFGPLAALSLVMNRRWVRALKTAFAAQGLETPATLPTIPAARLTLSALLTVSLVGVSVFTAFAIGGSSDSVKAAAAVTAAFALVTLYAYS